ncbi:nitroreductase family protein [Mycolicibacterium llatzerense]|uniref:nitroreductase family protein n=1 Tax=Mycolicibacterium llatzerense TaxID=280871 RepID=UPI0021B69A34|nr:nitroreductase family protein [Mycolicibacterium llatzerense]
MTKPPLPQDHPWLDALQQARRATPTTAGALTESAPRLWSDRYAIPVTDLGPTQPFAQTARTRRSVRRLSTPTMADLALIAARTGLTRHGATTELGNPVSSRPAPSAGARQPLQLVLITAEPLDQPRHDRAWVLDADAAVLRPATLTAAAIDSALDRFAAALGVDEPPPAAVVAVGVPQRTFSRYPDGVSLLWRETGALLMLVQLAATDIGLGSCLIGTCGALYPIGETLAAPVDLGAVAVGNTVSSRNQI